MSSRGSRGFCDDTTSRACVSKPDKHEMKRRYAFAQFYALVITDPWRDRKVEIVPIRGFQGTLELKNWPLDWQAERARIECISQNHYAFTLHRAAKRRTPHGAFNGYDHVIETRGMEIVQWALDPV